MKKAVIFNIFSGGMNAILSPLLICIITRVLGVESAGIFSIAYASACLFLNIGYWGMRNYQVSDINNRYNWNEYRISRILSTVAMVFVATVYVIIMERSITDKGLCIIGLTLIKALDAVEDIYHGKFQKDGRLDIAGFFMGARLLLQLISMSILIISGVSLVIAIFITFVIGAFLLAISIRVSVPYFEFDKTAAQSRKTWDLLLACMPICASSFLGFYLNNMSKYVIDRQLDNVAQAYYGYISMPLFLTYLFANFVYAPMLNQISIAYSDDDIDEFKRLILKGFYLISAIGVFILLAGALVGIPLLQLFYGVSLEEYKLHFILLLIGSIFYAYATYLIVIMTIMRKQKMCLITTLVCVIVSKVASEIFISRLQLLGAVIAYIVSMLLLCLIYVVCLFQHFRKKEK